MGKASVVPEALQISLPICSEFSDKSWQFHRFRLSIFRHPILRGSDIFR
jgi:hypothetical protein